MKDPTGRSWGLRVGRCREGDRHCKGHSTGDQKRPPSGYSNLIVSSRHRLGSSTFGAMRLRRVFHATEDSLLGHVKAQYVGQRLGRPRLAASMYVVAP